MVFKVTLLAEIDRLRRSNNKNRRCKTIDCWSSKFNSLERWEAQVCTVGLGVPLRWRVEHCQGVHVTSSATASRFSFHLSMHIHWHRIDTIGIALAVAQSSRLRVSTQDACSVAQDPWRIAGRGPGVLGNQEGRNKERSFEKEGRLTSGVS
jgi:hypothetical protein